MWALNAATSDHLVRPLSSAPLQNASLGEAVTSRDTICRVLRCSEVAHLVLERGTGIEPAPPAWKAGALPLSYPRTAHTTSATLRTLQAQHVVLHQLPISQKLAITHSHYYVNTFCHKKQAPPFRVQSLLVHEIVQFSRMVRCAGAFQKAHAECPPVLMFMVYSRRACGSWVRRSSSCITSTALPTSTTAPAVRRASCSRFCSGDSLPLPVFTSMAISLPCQHASISGKPLRCPHVPRMRATHAPRFCR